MHSHHMYSDIDVLVVEKKTTDHDHKTTRKLLLNYLNRLNISYNIVTFEDIRSANVSYFDPKVKDKGVFPKSNLVIALGGDGTLLHTSHYVGGNVRLVGVNSAPMTSKGYLCALKPIDISKKLEMILTNAIYAKHVKRLQVESSKKTKLLEEGSFGQTIPLCLNDVLICHTHPAATTRTQLTIFDQNKNQIEFSESIYSSGIWVSTVSGQTAAISSYDFPKQDEESDVIFVAIREPYFRKNEKKYPQTFFFHSAEKKFAIRSNMFSGLICVDGHESCAMFEIDDEINFSTPIEGILKLIL